jgi:hypothetical protein
MGNQDLTNLLADLVRTNATNRKANFEQVSGLSKAILAGTGLQKPYQSNLENNSKDPRGPSFVNRVLDVMSRPLYGTLNYMKGTMERTAENSDGSMGGDLKELLKATSVGTNTEGLKDIWAGLSGKEKTTGRDIMKAIPGDPTQDWSGPAKFAAGMGIDIIADPLTYLGVGLVPKIGKAAKASTEALKAVESGAASTAQSLTEEIAQRAAQQAQKLETVIPTRGMPAPAVGAPPRIFAAGAGPVPKLADDIVEQIPMTKPRTPIAAIEAGPTKVDVDPLDMLSQTLLKSKTGKKQFTELAGKLPEKADPRLTLKVLHEQIAATKSPVAQNLLRKEAEKVQAGIKPADILSEARVTPAQFPELTINERWIDTARKAAQNFLKSNRMKNINHVGQTNLYNKVLHAAGKVRRDRRQFHVLQMLRIAEEEVLSAGRHLVDGEGISVRLSDIANMSGGARTLTPKLVDDFRKARPSQQVENLKAFTTPQVASEILDPVIKTAETVAPKLKELPPSQTVQVGSEISKELSKLAEAAGASSREAKTAKAFIDDLFSVTRDGLYSSIQNQARNLVRQSSSGIVDSKALSKISEDVYSSLGANPKVLGRAPMQGKVVEGIMTKFATWWGAKDLKPFSREYIDTARNVAAAFSETLTPIVRATRPSQRATAFSIAQGKMAPGTPEEEALANQFKYLVERLMGTHGITENAEAVVLRSGTVMKELNDELPKTLQFVTTKGTDNLGRAFDYTNGQWMHSWKEWAVKEPAESLYQLTRAMQMVTRKNSMWDDAAARWGMPLRSAEFQHTVKGIDRLAGTYFPKQIADQLTNLQAQLNRDVFRTPNKGIELFDKVQRMWKTGVTVYSPSHHIRNLNGDIYLAALDGVVSPKPYAIATKVLHAYPTRYKDLESVFNIMDPNLRESALRARPGNIVLTTKHGEKMTAEQLYQAAESQGLFIRGVDIEDLMGNTSPALGTFGSKVQPFGGRVHETATKVSELRDHWVRLAHFTDILSKSRAPLRVAIEQAGRRVKKFHPDGMDMTGFEQNVMRRVIPFYSWMRKATPLVIEGAVMRPHITLAFPKAAANMQLATGIESEGPGDPFPMDQMFPDWIKEKGIGPIFQPGSGVGRDETWRGESPGYTIMNPTQPFIDQIAQIGSPGKTALSSLSPFAKIPIELMTGRNSLGIPLENVEGGVPGHLAQQIPAVGIGARITGMTRDNEPYNPEQLINWLTSAGITGTGPYQSQAQTEIRDLITQMAKKQRGDYR